MKNHEVWQAIENTFQTLPALVGPRIQPAIQELGLAEIPGWNQIVRARNLEPEPLTVDVIKTANPYTNPQNFKAIISRLIEHGLLDENAVLSDKGSEKLEALLAVQRDAFRLVDPLDDDSAEQLLILLAKLNEGIAKSVMIPHPVFDLARRSPIEAELPLLEKVLRYTNPIHLYRDDAHIAAWQDYDVNGQAWEIFTYIWREEATGYKDMPEQLITLRGYSEEENKAAMQTLVQLGWIVETDEEGKYTVTESGKAVREAAEAKTDEYFLAPFDVLDAEEAATLIRLLTQVKDEVNAFVEANPVEPQPQ